MLEPKKINHSSLDKSVTIPKNSTKADRRNAAKEWLSKNVKDRFIIACNGKKIRFNAKKSIWHLQNDASFFDLEVKAIPYIAEVFVTGKYIGEIPLTKERTDFVKIHTYRKWINIDGKRIHLEAKAGEYANGNIDVLPDYLLAYSQQGRIAAKNNAPSKIRLNSTILESAIPNPERVGTVDFNNVRKLCQTHTALKIIDVCSPYEDAKKVFECYYKVA